MRATPARQEVHDVEHGIVFLAVLAKNFSQLVKIHEDPVVTAVAELIGNGAAKRRYRIFRFERRPRGIERVLVDSVSTKPRLLIVISTNCLRHLMIVVGVFILIVWLWYSPGTTPELVGAFATGVIGWLVGAFTATFKT